MNTKALLLSCVALFLSHNASAVILTDIPVVSACTTDSVTGNHGDSDQCWGAFSGNDPKTTLTIGSSNYDFISSYNNDDDSVDGEAIEWSVSNGSTGTWAFNESFLEEIGNFLIVLKAANNPGWAAYSFFGDNNKSFSGEYKINWTNNSGKAPNLSHISLYAEQPSSVPEPSTLFLLGISLLGFGFIKRRKK